MYRTDIRLVMYKNGYEKLVGFYEENGLDMDLISDKYVREDKNGRVIIELDYLPLPKRESDIKNMITALNFLKDNNLSFHYIRIGETDTDVKNFMFTADGDLPIHYQYPEYIAKAGEN